MAAPPTVFSSSPFSTACDCCVFIMQWISLSWTCSKFPWICINLWWPSDSHSFSLSHAGFYRLHHRESELSNLFLLWKLNSWSALLPFPDPLSILLYSLWDAETRTAYRIQGVGQSWICTAALRDVPYYSPNPASILGFLLSIGLKFLWDFPL